MNNILSLIYTYLALQSLSMYPWENSRPTHVVCYLLLPLYLIIIIVSDKETQATIKQEWKIQQDQQGDLHATIVRFL